MMSCCSAAFSLLKCVDDLICLAALALVGFDRFHQIACPSVMEEKDALPDTPERSGSELIGARAALRDAVRKTFTHVVDEEVGEEIHRLVGKRGTRDSSRSRWQSSCRW